MAETIMVEKVATAILAKTPVGYGMTQSEANDYARAAIEALREPTRGMYHAAFDALVPASDASACWSAMIDAALNEEVAGDSVVITKTTGSQSLASSNHADKEHYDGIN